MAKVKSFEITLGKLEVLDNCTEINGQKWNIGTPHIKYYSLTGVVSINL